ncbi:hypothetical protein KBB05_04555 [Patescibacteria group bacterium]|nr:hypothetical protein [Patescibacteria group bacterium]
MTKHISTNNRCKIYIGSTDLLSDLHQRKVITWYGGIDQIINSFKE